MNKKEFPFNKRDVINAMENHNSISLEYGRWDIGSIKYGIQKYYVRFGGNEYIDDGIKHNTMYSFMKDVWKTFTEIELELAKQNIILVKEKCDAENGMERVWNCKRYTEIDCVTKIINIVPSKSFLALKKFLKDKANFDLEICKWYRCNLCQKRNSKSFSNYYYYAKDEEYCCKVLNKIKAEYSRGNVITTELETKEYFDNGYDNHCYEYEQYGECIVTLSVSISTQSGRNKRTFTL